MLKSQSKANYRDSG